MFPPCSEIPESEKKRLSDMADVAISAAAVEDVSLDGVTGAMVGAAKTLAFQWTFAEGGSEGLLNRWLAQGMPEDRKIVISKNEIIEGKGKGE
jgi:hypothetical protein